MVKFDPRAASSEHLAFEGINVHVVLLSEAVTFFWCIVCCCSFDNGFGFAVTEPSRLPFCQMEEIRESPSWR